MEFYSTIELNNGAFRISIAVSVSIHVNLISTLNVFPGFPSLIGQDIVGCAMKTPTRYYECRTCRTWCLHWLNTHKNEYTISIIHLISDNPWIHVTWNCCFFLSPFFSSNFVAQLSAALTSHPFIFRFGWFALVNTSSRFDLLPHTLIEMKQYGSSGSHDRQSSCLALVSSLIHSINSVFFFTFPIRLWYSFLFISTTFSTHSLCPLLPLSPFIDDEDSIRKKFT